MEIPFGISTWESLMHASEFPCEDPRRAYTEGPLYKLPIVRIPLGRNPVLTMTHGDSNVHSIDCFPRNPHRYTHKTCDSSGVVCRHPNSALFVFRKFAFELSQWFLVQLG